MVLVDVFPNNPPAAGVDVPKAPGVPKPDVAAIKEVYVPNLFACKTGFSSSKTTTTRTFRKSDYTPALVLPMYMACLKKTKHHTIQLKYQI